MMNSNTVGNIELVYSLFNQYIYQEAKNNINLVEHYYCTNPATMGNGMIRDFIDAIKTYPLESIDEPLFRSILARQGKNSKESDSIIREIIKYKMFDNKAIDPARTFLRGICSSSIIKKAENLYSNDPEGFLKYLKLSDYKSDYSDIMSIESFDQIDINSITAGNGKGFASRYDWINRAFDPLMKYEAGQIVIVSAPPGVGKSLFCMGEALTMAAAGAKVHYIALGDLKPKDFIVRMGSIYSGATFAEVQMNLPAVYKGLTNAVGNRLGLTIVPAAKVSADQYIEYIKDKDYEVLFIDYDSNFQSLAGDNLYSEYGKIYDRLTELSGLGKLVFIASQPTKPSWKYEEINMEDIGESARKVHSADVIVTIGRNMNSRNHMGKMKIAKNRRGEEGVVQPYIRLNNGRFIPLPEEVYGNLSMIKDKRIFSEGDINQLIVQNEELRRAASTSLMMDSNVPFGYAQQNQNIMYNVSPNNPFNPNIKP